MQYLSENWNFTKYFGKEVWQAECHGKIPRVRFRIVLSVAFYIIHFFPWDRMWKACFCSGNSCKLAWKGDTEILHKLRMKGKWCGGTGKYFCKIFQYCSRFPIKFLYLFLVRQVFMRWLHCTKFSPSGIPFHINLVF